MPEEIISVTWNYKALAKAFGAIIFMSVALSL